MYIALPTRVRKDPLGPDFYNRLVANHADAQQMAIRGHTPDGFHNEIEVPRAVGTIKNTGGTISQESDNSPVFTSVSGFTAGGLTGIAVINLDSAFASSPYAIDVTVLDSATETLPIIATTEVVSSTQFRVRLFKLASLAGNSWSAVDATFAVAVYALPFTSPASPLPVVFTPSSFLGSSQLGLAYDKWNQFTQNQATQRANALVEHTSAGAHNTRNVARGWARATYSGGTGLYTLEGSSSNITAVSGGGGTGIANFTLSGFALPMQVFAYTGYDIDSGDQPNTLTVTCFPVNQMSSTSVKAYSYRYDYTSKTWSHADCDVAVTIHRSAV